MFGAIQRASWARHRFGRLQETRTRQLNRLQNVSCYHSNIYSQQFKESNGLRTSSWVGTWVWIFQHFNWKNVKRNFFFRFINFLKNYKTNDLKIAFNAERSIQDAIKELSESETVTIAISYSIMFIYVALALGSFKSCRTFFVGDNLKFSWKQLKYLKMYF